MTLAQDFGGNAIRVTDRTAQLATQHDRRVTWAVSEGMPLPAIDSVVPLVMSMENADVYTAEADMPKPLVSVFSISRSFATWMSAG